MNTTEETDISLSLCEKFCVFYEDENFTKLLKSIKEVGIINPPVLSGNEVVLGGRRIRALLKLGIGKTKVKKVDVDELSAIKMAYYDNIFRISKAEEIFYIKRAYDFSKDINVVSQCLNINENYVRKILNLSNLPPKIIELLHFGKIDLKICEILSSLKNIEKFIPFLSKELSVSGKRKILLSAEKALQKLGEEKYDEITDILNSYEPEKKLYRIINPQLTQLHEEISKTLSEIRIIKVIPPENFEGEKIKIISEFTEDEFPKIKSDILELEKVLDKLFFIIRGFKIK